MADLNDDEYELTAEEAFARLSPDERRRFGRMMKQEGRKQDVDFADVDDDDDDDDDTKYDNPKKLAKMARRTKKKDPGLLGNLLESFGGSGGGGGKGPDVGELTDLAKTALKKIT
jgi:hypothetical protein